MEKIFFKGSSMALGWCKSQNDDSEAENSPLFYAIK